MIPLTSSMNNVGYTFEACIWKQFQRKANYLSADLLHFHRTIPLNDGHISASKLKHHDITYCRSCSHSVAFYVIQVTCLLAPWLVSLDGVSTSPPCILFVNECQKNNQSAHLSLQCSTRRSAGIKHGDRSLLNASSPLLSEQCYCKTQDQLERLLVKL